MAMQRDRKGSQDVYEHLKAHINWGTAKLVGQAWYLIRSTPLGMKSASSSFVTSLRYDSVTLGGINRSGHAEATRGECTS